VIIDKYLTAVGEQNPHDYTHEGGFARAVGANEAEDDTAFHCEVDVTQSLYAAKRFADAPCLDF